MIVQTSCSELLVDTAIHDPQVALERFNALFEAVGWESSPPLTLKLMEEIKENDGNYESRIDATVYDKDGNRASLEYGDNGYIHTGFRFDSNCNDWDHHCYPIFQTAIEKLNGELMACDGGTTIGYERWSRRDKNWCD